MATHRCDDCKMQGPHLPPIACLTCCQETRTTYFPVAFSPLCSCEDYTSHHIFRVEPGSDSLQAIASA